MSKSNSKRRAVIYARFSTELQRAESIEDQVEVCRRYATAQGWTVSKVYSDAAMSGASNLRPGFQQMMADARNGQFDYLVTEAIDRLSRNLADVSGAFDELEFARVGFHTVNQGAITQMHIGIMGTMAQMALKDMGEKVRRGQLGRVRAGKIPAGLAYGYEVVPPPPGSTDGGARRIKPEEAAVVRRIFTDYAKGSSPQQIAKRLNAEGVPGVKGRPWIDTTIRGQLDRGTGILNNTLYIGQQNWNRCSYVKDPKTRKRVARVNLHTDREIGTVPELRIIDDDLWARVKARQAQVHKEMPQAGTGNALNRTHRRKFLLSGLLECGCCGGGYTIVGADRYGCATRKGKGICDNTHTITRQNIEHRVLSALRDNLLTPQAIDEFLQALATETAEGGKILLTRQQSLQRELTELARKIQGIWRSIENGLGDRAMGERLNELQVRQAVVEDLLQQLQSPPPAPVLRASSVELYKAQVAELEAALNNDLIHCEASEALRMLIEKVVLTPDASAPNGLGAMLYGEMAAILSLASVDRYRLNSLNKIPPRTNVLGGQLSVVAGIGFEPMTFRL